MRESIGGGWLITIVVLFIVLFSGYLAVSINYTKAFKVKNYIINTIEQNEGFTKYDGNVINVSVNELQRNSSTQAKITAYLKSAGYFTTENSNEMKERCEGSDNLSSNNVNNYFDGGYCVKKICTDNSTYYKVTTFIKFQVPIIQTALLIEINGETKPLFFDTSDMQCYN